MSLLTPAHRHLYIGREYGNEQSYNQPGGGNPRWGIEQHHAKNKLKNAADGYTGCMIRNVGRHNAQIHFGMQEVIDACSYIQQRHEV